jgi:taurine transport system substrate-binding protein
MPERSRWLLGCLLTGALAMLVATGCGSGSAGSGDSNAPVKSIKFAYGVFNSPTMVQAGIQQGAFKNLAASFPAVVSGPQALPLITKGHLAGIDDVSAPPVLVALARHVPVKVVWMNHVESDALVTRPSIQSPDQLRGKKIAITAGSISEYLLDQYLAAHSIPPDSVTKVNLPPPSMPAAFRSGQVDGAYIWSPIYPQIVQRGAHVLARATDPTYVLVGAQFARRHGNVVQAFVCDLRALWQQFLRNPGAGYSAMAAKLGISARDAQALLPKGSLAPAEQAVPEWLGTKSSASKQARFLYEVGKWLKSKSQVEEAPALSQVQSLFDPSFAAKATAGSCPKA